DVRRLLRRYRDPLAVETAFKEVCKRWDRVLGAVGVRTPNPALDLLLNRWLLYQVLGCRVWGRSAFYQSGGAYGFRDQLQDGMALLDERVPFLSSPVLRPDQAEDYGLPGAGGQAGSVYEHCVRALEHSYRLGRHGL